MYVTVWRLSSSNVKAADAFFYRDEKKPRKNVNKTAGRRQS